MAFLRVDDRQASCPKTIDETLNIGNNRGDVAHVIAKAFAEAAGFGKIPLHVNDDECHRLAAERKGEGKGLDVSHQ